jgi:ketosteroid isomerase-like protein
MSNLETIRAIYELFAGKGLDRVLELVDTECVITQDKDLPWGGLHEGFDGVMTFAAAIGGTVHSTLTSEAMFEAGDQVINCGRSRGTVLATGVAFDVPFVHIWTIHNTKVTAAEFFIDTPAMLRALAQKR